MGKTFSVVNNPSATPILADYPPFRSLDAAAIPSASLGICWTSLTLGLLFCVTARR
jgi:hypothetical protein